MTLWYALQTVSGREQRCAERIRDCGWDAYIPMRAQRVRVRREPVRWERQERPIITGLVFSGLPADLRCDPYLWSRVVAVRHVLGIIGTGNIPRSIPFHQIEHMLQANDDLDRLNAMKASEPIAQPGEAVSVVSGPFEGFKGTVHALDGERYAVLLELLGAEREIEISGDMLAAG